MNSLRYSHVLYWTIETLFELWNYLWCFVNDYGFVCVICCSCGDPFRYYFAYFLFVCAFLLRRTSITILSRQDKRWIKIGIQQSSTNKCTLQSFFGLVISAPTADVIIVISDTRDVSPVIKATSEKILLKSLTLLEIIQ